MMKAARFWVYLALCVLWLHGAVASVLPVGYAQGLALLHTAGLTTSVANSLIWAGASADALMAIGAVYAYQCMRHAAVYQLGNVVLIGVYTVLASFLSPHLWLDPMGVLAKNMPLMALAWLMYQGEKNGLHHP